MENIELLKKLPAFSTEYKKANVKEGEALWSKALLISPLFSYVKNLPEFECESDADNALHQAEIIKRLHDLKDVNFSKNAVTVVLGNDGQYKSSVFYGYQLNTKLHLQILSYMVVILFNQFDCGFPSNTVAIDLNIMIQDLDLDQKSKSFYRKTIEDIIIRLAHSSSRIELNDGTVINDRYVYKYSHDESKNVFEITFGDIFIDSIICDEWRQKYKYKDLEEIKEGAARYLFVYISAMFRPIQVDGKLKKVSKISIDTIIAGRNFNVVGNKSKKKNATETINDALKYLADEVGFITHVEDLKRGIKNVWLNTEFSLKQFADAQRDLKKKAAPKPKSIKAVVTHDSISDAVSDSPVVETPVNVEAPDLQAAMTKIEMMFANTGVNPEYTKALAERAAMVKSDLDVWDVDQFSADPVAETVPESAKVLTDDDCDYDADLREFDDLMRDLDKLKARDSELD
ncbi:hypothetical protein V4100_000988 [Pseudomonas aeruginosa]